MVSRNQSPANLKFSATNHCERTVPRYRTATHPVITSRRSIISTVPATGNRFIELFVFCDAWSANRWRFNRGKRHPPIGCEPTRDKVTWKILSFWLSGALRCAGNVPGASHHGKPMAPSAIHRILSSLPLHSYHELSSQFDIEHFPFMIAEATGMFFVVETAR